MEEQFTAAAIYVRDLAWAFFDQTKFLHGLGDSSRNILEKAALLYDQPITAAKKKPFRAVVRLVNAHLGQELAPETQKTLAAVIAVQRNVIKRKELARLDLTAMQEREVLTIAAILRIAAGMNDSGSQQTTLRKVEAARDGVWAVVEGPEAASDAAVARQNARLWIKIGYPELHVMQPEKAASKLLPFPEPLQQTGVLPEDALAEAGRKAMLFNFARMLQHEEGARLGEDIEAVHDMRVATRRLRAAFGVFREAFEPEAVKPHLKGLRKTGRLLGEVRDLDVFMEKVQLYLETLPEEARNGLEPLMPAWQAQRDKARSRLIAHLDSREYASFKRKFNVFLQTPGAGARTYPKDAVVPTHVNELAPALIYSRLAAARAFEPFPEDAPIERYHALRIQLKNLRYSVEYFQEVLGKKAQEVVGELKQLQDHLGNLNDAQVATLFLIEFIEEEGKKQARLPENQRHNLQGVVDFLAYRHAERQGLMETFHPAWKKFTSPAFRRDLAQAISVL